MRNHIRRQGDEREVAKALTNIVMTIYGLKEKHFNSSLEALKMLVNCRLEDENFVDALSFREAVILCALLEKCDFKAGRDYGVYRCGAAYGLVVKSECMATINFAIRKLRALTVVHGLAVTILQKWRSEFGSSTGDVYEALDLAYKVLLVRNKLSQKCPACGRLSRAIVKECLNHENYYVYVHRICCNYRKTVVIRAKT